jgi:hypothetical protein
MRAIQVGAGELKALRREAPQSSRMSGRSHLMGWESTGQRGLGHRRPGMVPGGETGVHGPRCAVLAGFRIIPW